MKQDDKALQTFTSGTTHTVTNNKIVARNRVLIIPTSTPNGHLSVVAAAGSFAVTSSDDETGMTFYYLLF